MSMREKTINVAVVEDECKEAEKLLEMLDRYGKEHGIKFGKRIFSRADEFLANYTVDYDIVFFDIQMPGQDGMSAAKELRKSDKNVIIIFVTNMSQYAINGYEVNATDFMVKPLVYEHFATKLERITSYALNRTDVVLAVRTAEGMVSLSSSDIMYVEIMKHELIYHTTAGDYFSYGSLSKVEEILKTVRFVRCNSCYLVNPRYVESVGTHTTKVGGTELIISYGKRKEYRRAIAAYLGGLV